MRKRVEGYTIVEMLVVLGLFIGMAALFFPLAIRQTLGFKSETYGAELASAIYIAQQNAYNGLNDSDYGVKIFSNRYVIYAGESYESATATDQFNLPNPVYASVSGLTGGADQIHFEKGTLAPSVSGHIVISDDGGSYRITLNQEGLVYGDIQ